MGYISESMLEDMIARDFALQEDIARVSNFQASRNKSGKWKLTFLLREKYVETITTRRNEPRVFLRVNGLIKFAEKVGIKELTLKL